MLNANALYANDISGKVTSNDFPNGLPGVSVVIKGSSVGTITDTNGNYSLNVPSSDAVLIYSFIGYDPKEIKVDGQSIINVELSENAT